MPTLPSTGSISASEVNSALGRSSVAPIDWNDFELKTLAKVGNNSLSNTSESTTDFASLRGTTRIEVVPTSNVTQVNLFSTVSGSYNAGKSYITYYVSNDIVVGSSNTTVPALSVGGFASGDIVEIVLQPNGYIVGCGGAGGKGSGGWNNNSGSADPGYPGENGGTALYARSTTYVNNQGSVWGGGGGGGGGGGHNTGGKSRESEGGGGGGGGAGFIGGAIGPGGTNSLGYNGSDGSPGLLATGGAGGAPWPSGDTGAGGAGGGPGTAGATGDPSAGEGGFAGGSAGNYVDGNSFVSWVSVGSRLGGEV